MTSRNAARRCWSEPAKWPSDRKHCGWISSSQSPRVAAIARTASAASGRKEQLGATMAILTKLFPFVFRRVVFRHEAQ